MSTPPISPSFCSILTADFFVDLDVRCAPSLKASGGAGLALLRLSASDGPGVLPSRTPGPGYWLTGGWASVQSPPFPDFLSSYSVMGGLELLGPGGPRLIGESGSPACLRVDELLPGTPASAEAGNLAGFAGR
jgi:hypothetical protein